MKLVIWTTEPNLVWLWNGRPVE